MELLLANFPYIYSNLPKKIGKGRQVYEGRAAELCHVAERVRLGPGQHVGFCNEEVAWDCPEGNL